MHQKNEWVDYAKAIGIFLVVYGHVARGLMNAGLPLDKQWFELLDSVIYTFHMPLFFFLSGLFFYDSLINRGTTGLIANKLDTIIYPYVVWSLIQGFSELVLANYTNGQVTAYEVLSFAWQPRAQFWFLFALFQIFVVCSLLYKLANDKNVLLITLFFGLIYIFKTLFFINALTIFIIDYAVFFAFGIWFKEIASFFEAKSKTMSLIFGLLFLTGQYYFHYILKYNYTEHGIVLLALTIISIIFIACISMFLSQLKVEWLVIIGSSSMIIYLMHILVSSGARIIFRKAGIDSVHFHLVLGTLAGLGIPLMMKPIINTFKFDFLLTPPRLVSASSLLTKIRNPRTAE